MPKSEKIDNYHLGQLNWPVSQIDIQCNKVGFVMWRVTYEDGSLDCAIEYTQGGVVPRCLGAGPSEDGSMSGQVRGDTHYVDDDCMCWCILQCVVGLLSVPMQPIQVQISRPMLMSGDPACLSVHAHAKREISRALLAQGLALRYLRTTPTLGLHKVWHLGVIPTLMCTRDQLHLHKVSPQDIWDYPNCMTHYYGYLCCSLNTIKSG